MKLTSTFKCKLVVLCCLLVVFALAFGAFVAMGSGNFALAEEEAQLPVIISVGGNAVSSGIGSLPGAIINEPYKDADGNNYKIVATGSGTLTYLARESTSGSYGAMPAGLHLNPETGEFSGTITETGTFGITVTVTNEYGSTNICCYIQIYKASDKPVIKTDSLPNGSVNAYYSQEIQFDGLSIPVSASISAGQLPDGLHIRAWGGQVIIYGYPSVSNDFTFTVRIQNGAGIAEKQFQLIIGSEVILPVHLPYGTIINDDYSFMSGAAIGVFKGQTVDVQFAASGTNTEENPIRYIMGGSLPPGLSMDEYGHVTGTVSEDISIPAGDSVDYWINGKLTNDNGENTTPLVQPFEVFDGYKVYGIKLIPNETSLEKGSTLQFQIDWSRAFGTELDKTDVTWSFDFDENNGAGTTLTQTGLLTVGLDQSYKYVYVRATHNQSGQYWQCKVHIVDHAHTTQVVEAVAATCTTDGNIKHYKCTVEGCSLLFRDAAATQMLSASAVKLPASHTFGDKVPAQNATCSAEGMQAHYECSVCHQLADSTKAPKTADELKIAINPDAHRLDGLRSQVPATCASEGAKAYRECEYCKKHFDDDGVEMESITIAKNENHQPQSEWSKDFSGHYHACTRVGCKDGGKLDFASHTPSAEAATETTDVHCTVCGFVITPVQSHVHGLKLVPGQSQTCTKDGTKSYYVCSEGANPCGKYFADKDGSLEIASTMFEEWKVIPASHTFGEWVQASQPNCAKTGEVAHKTCSVCKKHFDDKNVEIKDIVIPKNNLHVVPNTQTWSSDQLGHWHACVREGCKDNGKADYVAHTRSAQAATETTDIHCTVCQFIIEAPKGHVHNLKFIQGTPASCTKEGTKAYYVCSEGANPCGKYFEDKDATTEIPASRLDLWKVISVTHNFGEWVQGFAATCASEGEAGHKTCSVCKKNFDADGKEIVSIVLPKNHNHQTNSVWVKDETGHWYVCTREGCKDGGIVDFAPHTKSATAPTERDDVHCLVCLYVIQNTTEHVHGLKLVPGTPASCTTAGEKDYYQCTKGTYPCYNYFADAQGTTEIASADLGEWKVIAAGHTFGEWQQGFEANCTQTGEVAHKTCSACNKHFDANGNEIENIVIAINQNHVASSEWLHDETGHWHVCGQQGCTFDGKLDFAAHTPSAEQATKDNDVHCTVCQLVLQEALSRDGLSGGAIAGIAVSSTVVAAGGGFSVFWFVIKKKKFADLVTIFKK